MIQFIPMTDIDKNIRMQNMRGGGRNRKVFTEGLHSTRLRMI